MDIKNYKKEFRENFTETKLETKKSKGWRTSPPSEYNATTVGFKRSPLEVEYFIDQLLQESIQEKKEILKQKVREYCSQYPDANKDDFLGIIDGVFMFDSPPCGDCKEPVLDRDLVRKVIETILKFGVNYDQLSSLQKRLLEDDVSLLARKSITQVRKEWEEERNQMLAQLKEAGLTLSLTHRHKERDNEA